MAEITPAERARLAALLEQATPGPWEAEEGGGRGGWIRNATTREWSAMSCGETSEQATANAALIVAAVNAAPALLAALDAAEAHVHDALERVGELTRERDEARQDALNAEREGQMAVRALCEIRTLVASEVDVRDGIDGPRPNLAMLVDQVVIAAFTTPDLAALIKQKEDK